jgi:hypothetical protein
MMPTPFLVSQHLGHLSPWQQILVFVLAFGPFILLGIVVAVVRRRDIAEEERAEAEGLGRDNPDT